MNRIPSRPRLALPLGLLLFALFGLTASNWNYGYDPESVKQADAYLNGKITERPLGGIRPFTRGGIVDVAQFLPFVALRTAARTYHWPEDMIRSACTFAIPFYTVVLVLLFYGLCAEIYKNRKVAAQSALLLATGTIIWPYAKYGMETQQTLWMLAGIWSLLRFRSTGTVSAASMFGISLGCLVLTKVTGSMISLILVGAGLVYMVQDKQWRRPYFMASVAFAMAFALLGVGVFLDTNITRYGDWLKGTRYNEHDHFDFRQLSAARMSAPFISWGKSIYLYSPVLLLGLFSFASFARKYRYVMTVLVPLLATTLFHLAFNTWTDERWGMARLHYIMPLLALPVGQWLIDLRFAPRLRHLATAAIVLAGLLIQILAVSFNYTYYAMALMRDPMYTETNVVWNPSTTAMQFHIHLLRSRLIQMNGGKNQDYVFKPEYMVLSRPDNKPPPVAFPVHKYDDWDLWYVQNHRRMPSFFWNHPFSALVPILILLAILGGHWLARNLRRASLG